MNKSEIIALLFLPNQDLSNLETLSDYIKQFDEIEKQVKSLLENSKPKS